MIDISIVDRYHVALTPELRTYLNHRHICDDIISAFKIGYGEFYGQMWLTIPIMNVSGETEFFKLKRPPSAPESQPKGMVFPKEMEATIFPRPFLTRNLEEVVLCEGEPDCLALLSHGIEAVCSTAGAQTFKEEWLDWFPENCRVVICYDMDEAGEKGKQMLLQMFNEKRPDVKIGVVDFPEALKQWRGKDVSDFFMNPLCWPKEDPVPVLPPVQ